MRLTIGVLLAALISPMAHAELIDEINDRNELRIAVEANTPPFNFKEGDKLTGFEVELGEALAREMDVYPSFIVTDQADLLAGVESGKYDIALNHITATPELKERLDFSSSYVQSKAKPPEPAPADALVIPFAPKALDAAAASTKPVNLAIPFQKNNPAFQSVLDNALQRLKDNGRLDELSQKWLGAHAQGTAP
ncbi:transporter substrate-binding domain-containing protein [Pseudomonas sp. R5(2019)]|uniref:transporter substrate-binding domain-containing protein n=1 Tax=Pseudomonas sp. R5(2019) TaxID=2697566 RepID=UPI0014133A9B|nr:transporter substrate-binding domain-containing protein [Pseudomonas sp. R5(2019)]NBA97883.1 transporter substrate-binding domain-containing protein [Pseudomonas sp. R5(2019)]